METLVLGFTVNNSTSEERIWEAYAIAINSILRKLDCRLGGTFRLVPEGSNHTVFYDYVRCNCQ